MCVWEGGGEGALIFPFKYPVHQKTKSLGLHNFNSVDIFFIDFLQ